MKTARPLEQRIAAHIRLDGECWTWTGSLTRDGYGRMSVLDVSKLAHRVTYEHLIGPVPEGLTLDHLCRVRSCVNPSHLEPVTQAVNVARGLNLNTLKTHCKRGHAFDQRNTYLRPAGGRACRTCLRLRWHQIQQAA